MAKKKTSIQINGKQYDALSGALLSFEETAVPARVKSIDGVIGGTSTNRITQHAVKPAPRQAVKPRAAKPVTTVTARTPAAHAHVQRSQPSQTLMRHAVSKPTVSIKRRAKAQTATHHSLSTITAPVPSIRMTGNNHRATRASHYALSPRVSHFHTEKNVIATVAHEARQAVAAFDAAVVIPQTFAAQAAYKPDIRRIQYAQADNTSDIFEQALRRATSHEELPVEPLKERSRLASLRRRMVSFIAGAVAVLALVGLFGYQKQDSLQFKAAARQAGFSATLPGYQPRGYAFDAVKSNNGYVHVKYSSASVGGSYTISETRTDWNAQNLLDQLATAQNQSNLAAVQAQGRTVYLFGRNQAAWVNKGVLYQVLGNGVLSSQDFTQIASSM